MKICLLSDAYEESESPMKEHDLPCDPSAYFREAEWERAELIKATAVREVIRLAKRDYDLFFNLCDGAWDDDRPGVEVVQTLERLGQAFTGANSEFYEPSREAMKRVCRAWGVDTPAGFVVRGDADLERALDELRFPLIVKHPSSYSSIGLTRASRVETAAALRERVGEMAGAYGAALVEEFVAGREFTVLVAENPDDAAEPTTYTPIEFRFPEGETFKHFDLKWVDYAGMRDLPADDLELETRLRDASARLFRGLHGAGYGRCDLRVDAEGRAWMLEINPNCGVYYPPSDPGSADLCLLHDPAGHTGFTGQVIAAALARRARRRRSWEARATREGEYGLFATRAIAAGETVIAFEEEPHTLVSRERVEHGWGEPQRGWFDRYAWPLSDEVWVMWGRDPEDWKPIDHACEPSAWLAGLDVVARRDLAPGEEITLDYATFCNERMPGFACRCGAAECRGTIRGDDLLRGFVARYGEHVSDYVRRRRLEAGLAVSRGTG
ncbi:MAG: SET domain-containing protein-lysine N-methyltransferase [Longimicrobiaceae bacterium]